MSFFGGLAVNTLFEQLSGELLQARYETRASSRSAEACKLILRDEARHIQFGRIVMRRFSTAPRRKRRCWEPRCPKAARVAFSMACTPW